MTVPGEVHYSTKTKKTSKLHKSGKMERPNFGTVPLNVNISRPLENECTEKEASGLQLGRRVGEEGRGESGRCLICHQRRSDRTLAKTNGLDIHGN